MNNKLLISLLFCTFAILNAQLYFPDDNGGVSQYLGTIEELPKIPKNLTQLRGTEQYDKYVEQIISTGLLKLTLAIQNVIIKSTTSIENVVYAPVSIGAALALVLLGANGKTFDEMITVMGLAAGLDIQTKSQVVHEQFGRMIQLLQSTSGFNLGHQVNFATAVFVQENYPIRTLYKQTAEALYESEILNVNFKGNGAQQTINNWVNQKTNGKIRELLADSPSVSTRVIIASAMYFKAEWEYPFFDGSTKRRPFYPNGRKTLTDIEVEMMSNGGVFPYFRDTTLNCEILGLPYKGNQTTMYIIMPFHSNKEVLQRLETSLTTSDLEKLVSNAAPTRSILVFPKMKIDSTIDLRQAMELLGVKTLFSPSDANLGILSPGENLQTLPNIPDLPVNINSASAFSSPVETKISPNINDNESMLIFTRMGETANCTDIFNPNSTTKKCEDVVNTNNRQQRILYKKIGSKVGRRITRKIPRKQVETLDTIRQLINKQSTANSYQNPGLYADRVIHKVYMDITESGTEAAAATSVSLSRDGGRVTFRVDVPFIFFIRHEQTKTILFWGSVNTPTPNFKIV